MREPLSYEIEKIKKNMIVSFTKYTLSGEEDKSIDAILSSVLLTWFDPIKNTHDFYSKFGAFMQLDKMIKQSYLFDMVETISSAEDLPQAQKAVSIYEALSQNEDYVQIASVCGYRLPSEFGTVSCYFDGTLKQKLQFYRHFYDRLEKIFSELSYKEAMRR